MESHRKHKRRSSSSSDDSPKKVRKHSLSKRKKKINKHKLKRKKSKHTSSDTSSSSSSSSDSSSSSSDNESLLLKTAKKKSNKDSKMKYPGCVSKDRGKDIPKKTKDKKKDKKRKSKTKRKATEETNECAADVPVHLMEKAKAMAPMTKDEWDKRQNVVKRVFDESSGRHRLIKGDGEVIEEIVSKDRHKAINQQATKGDGDFFQNNVFGPRKP